MEDESLKGYDPELFDFLNVREVKKYLLSAYSFPLDFGSQPGCRQLMQFLDFYTYLTIQGSRKNIYKT